MYGDVILQDGPQRGGHVPFHGLPRYATGFELERDIPGGLFRRPRRVLDVYKVSRGQYGPDSPGQATFVGTVDITPKVAY